MSRLTSLALLLVALPASAATPIQSAGNLGLGLGGGSHVSGLSGKYFMAQDFSAQLVVGWWGAGRDWGGIGLSGDLLWEQRNLTTTEPVDIAWNIGPGVTVLTAGGSLGLGVTVCSGSSSTSTRCRSISCSNTGRALP